MKSLVITHAKRPPSFGKTLKPAFYFNYYYNKKALMTALVFNDWIGKIDRQMRLARSQDKTTQEVFKCSYFLPGAEQHRGPNRLRMGHESTSRQYLGHNCKTNNIKRLLQ